MMLFKWYLETLFLHSKKEEHPISIMKISQLIMFRETIAFCAEY
jgi:hypothetical protein